jgi:hypothetical protein
MNLVWSFEGQRQTLVTFHRLQQHTVMWHWGFRQKNWKTGHKQTQLLINHPDYMSWLSRPEALRFLPSTYSVALTRLSAPRSRPTTSQENLVAPATEPGPLDL